VIGIHEITVMPIRLQNFLVDDLVMEFELHIEKGYRGHHHPVDEETTDPEKDVVIDIAIIIGDELGLAFDAAELIVLFVVVIDRV
jgi:hypothetical protein